MCETCQNAEHNKNLPRKARPVRVESPWEVLALDIHGPFPETSQSNTHVLLVTDYFTKWVEAAPLQKKDPFSVAKALATVFYRFGASKNIYTSQSWDFCEEVSRHLCERWNISQLLTPSAEPAGPGSAEVLSSSIRSVVSERPSEWDAHLDPLLFEFRTSVHSATKYSPFFLMFNRYVCLSSEVTAAPGSRGPARSQGDSRLCALQVDFVKDSKEQGAGSAKADGLPPFTATVQEQQS
ncbi:GIN1 protein, partial [Notiomystis cincta]|nr:GIN1 protein [Notiomystis cincta]